MDRWDSALVPTEGADFRVGVKIRVYNATLRNGLFAMGHPFYQSAKEMGISVDLLYQYIRFARYPTLERAARICVYIGIPMDDVFPEHLINMRAVPTKPLELTSKQYEDMLAHPVFTNPFDGLTVRGLPIGSKEMIADVLATLTERERRVITLRFGLDDGITRTLEEVGADFGSTRENIRQIEAKALRKMRHPNRSKRLRELWVEGETWKP